MKAELKLIKQKRIEHCMAICPFLAMVFGLGAIMSCDHIANSWNYKQTAPLVTITREGLIAEWLFSGDAADTGGGGHHGTVSGPTMTTDRFGKANSAYAFDGSANTEIIISPFSIGTTFTVSAWVNFGNITIYSPVVLGGPDYYYVFAISNTTITIGAGSSQADEQATSILNQNWVHLVVTRVGPNTVFYKNSIQVTGAQSSDTLANLAMTITRIGNYNPTWRSPLNGKADDIRIYNRVLSTAEINDLYHEGGWVGN